MCCASRCLVEVCIVEACAWFQWVDERLQTGRFFQIQGVGRRPLEFEFSDLTDGLTCQQAHFFKKKKKYCLKTSNGTEIIAVSMLFRRLKILYSTLLGLAIPQLSQARSALKIAIPGFLLVGQVSLFSAVESVVWESCPVTRPPSCARMHRLPGKPLPPPTRVVSSSTYLFGWTNHGFVTASNGANTTKMRSQQGQNDQTNERSGLCHLGRHGSHFFFLCTRLPEGRQKKTQNSKKY